MNKPYAEAVYVGIITDTGNFEHGAYSSEHSELLQIFSIQVLKKRKYLT